MRCRLNSATYFKSLLVCFCHDCLKDINQEMREQAPGEKLVSPRVSKTHTRQIFIQDRLDQAGAQLFDYYSKKHRT